MDSGSNNSPIFIEFQGWKLDLIGQALIAEDGKEVSLGDTELAILKCLINGRGRLVRRDQLERAGWGDSTLGANNLDQAILTIRKAFKSLGFDGLAVVKNVHGRGFKFTLQPISKTAEESRSVPEQEQAFPVIWNVPFEKNPFVVGRDKILQDLHSEFAAGTPSQILIGLSGRGKTQLAVEYAYRYRAEYDAIWWVRARFPETLELDLIELADDLDLRGMKSAALNEILKRVRRTLRQKNYRVLVVLDDAIDRELIAHCLGHGIFRTLVTTSNVSFQRLGRWHEVGDLEPADAVKFLARRLRDVDQDSAAGLAKELGYLPLALEYAAAYIETAGISVSKYLQKVIKERGQFDAASNPVLQTWATTLLIVKYQSVSARILIMACSALAAEKIPIFADVTIPLPLMSRLFAYLLRPFRWYLTKTLPAEFRSQSSLRCFNLDEALLTLRRFSLVQTDGTSFWFHELVLSSARAMSKPVVMRMIIRQAIRLLNAISESVTVEQLSYVLPHYLTLIQRAEECHFDKIELAYLYENLADFLLFFRGDKSAWSYYTKAFTLAQQYMRRDDPRLSKFFLATSNNKDRK